MSQSVFSRELEPIGCMCVRVCKEICFKELAQVITKADTSKICRVGCQPGGHRRANFKSEGCLLWIK